MTTGTLDIFKLLERVELAMARVYRELAQTLAGDPEAHGLFSRLEMEEQAHAREVVLQRKLHMQSDKPRTTVAAGREGLLQVLEEMDIVSSAVSRLDLTDALRLCDAFEAHAAESHYRRTMTAGDEHLARLATSLGRGDERHRERLRAFAADRSIELD